MPIPQVNDRIKEAPAVVLRAVFAGVGQLLLAADKVRARAGQSWPPDRTAAKDQARTQSRWRTLDEAPATPRERATSHNYSAQRPSAASPGSVTASQAPTASRAPTTASGAPTTAGGAPTTASRAPTTARERRPFRAAPAAQQPVIRAGDKSPVPPATEQPAAPAGPADAPPLPGYDDLTLPSIRARMRVMDAAAIQALVAYEQGHAHRDDVIAMLERRLAKITAE